MKKLLAVFPGDNAPALLPVEGALLRGLKERGVLC